MRNTAPEKSPLGKVQRSNMDRTYETGGFFDGLGLRQPEEPEPITKPKTAAEIYKAHDLCVAFLLGDIPSSASPEYMQTLCAVTDALCWVLNHDHAGNKGEGFQKNLNEMAEIARLAGLVAVEAPPPTIEGEGVATFENKLRISLRGDGDDTMVIFGFSPREIPRELALNCAAWIVAIAEREPGEFDKVLEAVKAT